jgi:7,8-dihydropterin-6-yl-methyl-4-(beta-D-ribofuranosyl)aminobenzene 5'-phosphate synthase
MEAVTMKNVRFVSVILAALSGSLLATSNAHATQPAPDPNTPVVDSYRIIILSDSIPGRYTIGEWGFSAVVEVTSGAVTKRFLFDTSDKANTVIFNAGKLGVDLCSMEDVVISHSHSDHTGGLVSLRNYCASNGFPSGLSKAYVAAPEIFWSRRDAQLTEKNLMVTAKPAFEAANGAFLTDETPHQFLLPGVFLTGRIVRTHDEKTYVPTSNWQIKDPTTGQLSLDVVPEDQALVINTATETVILTGCAHAGTVNTMEQAVRMVGGHPYLVLAGGLHLYQMDRGDRHTEGTLDWEAQNMTDLNVMGMLGGHCTGFERFFYVRDYVKLTWAQAAMSAVGTILSKSPRFTFTSPQAVNIPMDTPK